MRIDELKKELKSIGEKHNINFKVAQEFPRTFIAMDSIEGEKIITRVDNEAEKLLDTSYIQFERLKDEIRAELFNLFVEYAKTPISDRKEEKRFIVPLPGLVTTDGEQQYLTHKEEHFFACRRNKDLRQTWKEKDLEYIPEEYRKYAVELSSVEQELR